MRVLVTPDYRTLSQTAADLFIKAVRTKPDLRAGLPTGSTPLSMYEAIVNAYRTEHLDLSRLVTFNLDEYLDLPAEHPKSYHTYMQRYFFDHVNLLPANSHIPEGAPGVDAAEESDRYERAIRDAGGIDLLVVGIGSNGHIAFNEPGSPFTSRTRVVNLAHETIANARQHFGADPVPQRAITIGIGTMMEARHVLLLASGAAKRDAVTRALRGPVSEAVPASALQMHGDVIVIVDEAASSS